MLDWGVSVVLSETSEPVHFSRQAAGVDITAILCQHETDFQPSLTLAAKFVVGYNIQSVARAN